MSAPVISCEAVTRRYGSGDRAFTAVDRVDLEVHRGELFGLLGTNGAGKTSTMELLEGLARPTSGCIRVLGRDPVRSRRELRPQMGIMLQSGGLPRELTVHETLTMWRGTCSRPSPVGEVLELVDLTHRSDVRVGMLSGGEQRKLDLACALIGRPRLLFLDEPTTGLDPESRRNTWELLERLRDAEVTMVLTTHYLDEAQSLCDRLVLMHRGQVRLSGTVREIVAAHPSRIRFDRPVRLPALPSGLRASGPATPGDAAVIIETDDLQADLHRLLDWARGHRVELRGLQANGASLESVFLGLTDEADHAVPLSA